MSVSFNFYVGRRSKTIEGKDVYSIVGPYYVNKSGEMEICPLYSRSRSFIDGCIMDCFSRIPVDSMAEKLKDIGTDSALVEGNIVSFSFWISINDVNLRASHVPMRGYVRVEDYSDNYDADPFDRSEVYSLEYYCGLSKKERNNYVFVSYVDKRSIQYVFNNLYEGFMASIPDVYNLSKDDLGIILVKC